MTAHEYISTSLKQINKPIGVTSSYTQEELVESIFRLLTSKKFRKYALTEEYATHIRNAIHENVSTNQPINLTFLGGCYKLWRLEEAPESDWAELFSHMYFTRWVKPICDIYAPGVWFDFFLDDVIVSRLNNISEEDVEKYRASRQTIIDFLKPYQPNNFKMTLTGIGSLFNTRQAYEVALEESIQKLSATLPDGIPQLNDAKLASVELNVRATPEQLSDPQWREKVELVHSAYMAVKAATGYSTTPTKIRAFSQPFPNGTCIAVGTTKDSIAKFWAGVGALQPRDESFRQIVLSPSQLASREFEWEAVNIPGLNLKNFDRIRVLR